MVKPGVFDDQVPPGELGAIGQLHGLGHERWIGCAEAHVWICKAGENQLRCLAVRRCGSRKGEFQHPVGIPPPTPPHDTAFRATRPEVIPLCGEGALPLIQHIVLRIHKPGGGASILPLAGHFDPGMHQSQIFRAGIGQIARHEAAGRIGWKRVPARDQKGGLPGGP